MRNYIPKFTRTEAVLRQSHELKPMAWGGGGGGTGAFENTFELSYSMGQDPNFHISVPSGWAKLGNVFHVRICPMHYLSHDRPLNSAAFMWLSPISIILLFKNNIFLFVSDFQLISKINLSSMIVLMKCNCTNTRQRISILAICIHFLEKKLKLR